MIAWVPLASTLGYNDPFCVTLVDEQHRLMYDMPVCDSNHTFPTQKIFILTLLLVNAHSWVHFFDNYMYLSHSVNQLLQILLPIKHDLGVLSCRKPTKCAESSKFMLHYGKPSWAELLEIGGKNNS